MLKLKEQPPSIFIESSKVMKTKKLLHCFKIGIIICLMTLAICKLVVCQIGESWLVFTFHDDVPCDYELSGTYQKIPEEIEKFIIEEEKKIEKFIKDSSIINDEEKNELRVCRLGKRRLDDSFTLWVVMFGEPFCWCGSYYTIEDNKTHKCTPFYFIALKDMCVEDEKPIISYKDFDKDGKYELIVKEYCHPGSDLTWITENYYSIEAGPVLKKVFSLEKFGTIADSDDLFKIFKGKFGFAWYERKFTYDFKKKEIIVKCLFKIERDIGETAVISKETVIYKKDEINGCYYPYDKKGKEIYGNVVSARYGHYIRTRGDYEKIILLDDWE